MAIPNFINCFVPIKTIKIPIRTCSNFNYSIRYDITTFVSLCPQDTEVYHPIKLSDPRGFPFLQNMFQK